MRKKLNIRDVCFLLWKFVFCSQKQEGKEKHVLVFSFFFLENTKKVNEENNKNFQRTPNGVLYVFKNNSQE